MMSKPFRWSAHALSSLKAREIERAEAEKALAEREHVESVSPSRAAYMRRYQDVRLGQPMLLRVIVEEENDARVVVTVYTTSKIAKYLKGVSP